MIIFVLVGDEDKIHLEKLVQYTINLINKFKNTLITWLAAFCKFNNGSEDLFKNNLNLFSLGGGSFFRCGDGA